MQQHLSSPDDSVRISTASKSREVQRVVVDPLLPERERGSSKNRKENEGTKDHQTSKREGTGKKESTSHPPWSKNETFLGGGTRSTRLRTEVKKVGCRRELCPPRTLLGQKNSKRARRRETRD